MQHSSYDQILDLHPSELLARLVPPRSRLYPMEPIGIGSPYVECLTGYAARLADRHHVTLSNLMAKEVRPALGKPPAGRSVDVYITADKAVNGIGSTASDLVMAFEELTSRKRLKYTTMLPWKDLLSSRLLIRPNRAWCSACYEESADAKRVYDQLIWTLSAVSACAKHGRRLESVCPHCGRGQTHIACYSRPGHCHSCKRWLNGQGKFGGDVNRSTFLPTEKEIWIAEQVGELLTMTPDLSDLDMRASFAKGLAKCVEKYGFSKISAFVFDLPVTDATIKVWLKQTQAPILGSLLEICFRLNKRLSDLMLPNDGLGEGIGDITLEQHMSQPCYAANTNTSKGPANWDIVETELRKAAAESPPPPLTKFVKKFRRNSTTLKRKFPELTTSIIERSRNYYRPRLDDELAERTLIAACTENPPPSLPDIARRLGRTGGPAILRMKFPELCRKVTERWRAERKRALNYEEIEKQLRAVLEEDPAPSFVTVTKRLNISRGLLATKFKELAAMISARFKAHRQEMKELERAVLAEEILQICRDLIAEDLYPSRERVSARLSKRRRSGMSEELRLQTIKELKLTKSS